LWSTSFFALTWQQMQPAMPASTAAPALFFFLPWALFFSSS